MPETTKIRSIRFPETLLKQIEDLAKKDGRSPNNFIIFHLQKAVDGLKKK